MINKDKTRQYAPSTVKKLHALSGNQCASPDCSRQLIARDGETIISKICHIEAASENGPRYKIDMTDDERRHFDNLILLCDECHSIIDNKENEIKYPVSLLKEWKKNHEGKLLYNKLNSNPSLLKLAVNAIASLSFEENGENQNSENEKLQAPDIEQKISHNAIKRNKSLIETYKVYHIKINTLYNELERQGSFKKEKLLRNIKLLYVKTKGKYIGNAVNPMQLIRDNADNIIEDIENSLLEKMENDGNHYDEDIDFGIWIIMVDAFMRCKILEEPPK